MRAPDVRAAWLRCQVLLVLLVPALAVASGQPMTDVVAVGALALLGTALTVLVAMPSAVAVVVTGARLRAWDRTQGEIRRAEQPDRPGRPHPRAPGAGSAAPEH
jgi:hypothetical protein